MKLSKLKLHFSSLKILTKRLNIFKKTQKLSQKYSEFNKFLNSDRSLNETNATCKTSCNFHLMLQWKEKNPHKILMKLCKKKIAKKIVIGKEAIKKTVGSMVDRLKVL